MIRISDSTSRRLPFDFAYSPSFTPSSSPSLVLFIAALSMMALAGCGPQKLEGSERASVDAGPKETSQGDDLAIILDGREITVAEVDEHMKDQFMKEFSKQPDEKQFSMRENAARDLVQSIVIGAEAKKRGIGSDELLEEIADAVAKPTSEEIATWYEANQARLRGASLEDVSTQIDQLLSTERQAKALEDFLNPKLEAMSWRIVLAPPRQDLEPTRLSRGSADAPITIMTFSDYQCPYCILAEPLLAEMLSRYPDKVRIVHRHFPLDSIHPFARPAAEAAMCADEQGKFWEFHQGIFDLAGKLNENSLAKIGSDLDLDPDSLNRCIEERRFKDFVDADFAAGRAAGVTGTPAFFINGITFTGARDADEMSRQVDLELARIEGS
jgi:predicted DsbA family dithiol-disulfide isomerase